ncbi:hypothetical protein L1049_026777 [Liquidambar formosana]|uniref:Exostosin GT47 domain-containing protein n=1 Tax=Liquidambar formosana TaxID=63359 RepID=A0AAP0NDA2_LIQFO
MGSPTTKTRTFAPHHNPPCTRTHQIGALALIATTFFLTRLFDQSFSSCNTNTYSSDDHVYTSQNLFRLTNGGSVSWPDRGYGSLLALKIYVYDELEIDGLKALMYGRDGKISPDACVKGQWGTQVKIHRLLLQSRFRTRKKEEADLFFVPAYAKCVRMMGGLNDKEINQTYVRVLSQMPYFRLSGGPQPYIHLSEGDRTDKRDTSAFNTWKDIIIPGNVDDGMTKSGATLVQPLPLSKRKYLANFLGRAQGKMGRLQLMELSKQYPDKVCLLL